MPNRNDATLQWLQKDEATFDMDDMERKEQWQYYVSSYVGVEPTEGVNREGLFHSVLTRNLPSDYEDKPKPLISKEDLTLRICLNSFKMMYKEGGE